MFIGILILVDRNLDLIAMVTVDRSGFYSSLIGIVMRSRFRHDLTGIFEWMAGKKMIGIDLTGVRVIRTELIGIRFFIRLDRDGSWGGEREGADDGIDPESIGHRGRMEVQERRPFSVQSEASVTRKYTSYGRKLPSSEGGMVAPTAAGVCALSYAIIL